MYRLPVAVPIAFAFAVAVMLTACGKKGGDGSRLEVHEVVYTTFYPSTWMADRLCGGAVDVVCPLPEGEDPIFWRPSNDVVLRYSSARVVVVNGAAFEKWVATASLPPSRVVDLSRGFRERFLTFETTTHSHGAKGKHTHEGIDGHTWLDPRQMKAQAETLAAALARAFPEHAASIRANGTALQHELDGLIARLDGLDASGSTLFASHPAYDYLARAEGWSVKNFALDPASDVSEEERAGLAALLAGVPNPIMLWETAPAPGPAGVIEALGARNVTYSPCETLDTSLGRDYIEVMNGNVTRLAEALSR